MATARQFIFRDDWEKEKNIAFNENGKKYAPYIHGILGSRESLNAYKEPRRKELEQWDAEHPKPKYTRDELLIEIAKRLNIDLI